jgi:hypothetical protein
LDSAIGQPAYSHRCPNRCRGQHGSDERRSTVRSYTRRPDSRYGLPPTLRCQKRRPVQRRVERGVYDEALERNVHIRIASLCSLSRLREREKTAAGNNPVVFLHGSGLLRCARNDATPTKTELCFV